MDLLVEELSDLFVVQGGALGFSHCGEGLLDHFVEGRMETEIVHISEDIFSVGFFLQALITTFQGL